MPIDQDYNNKLDVIIDGTIEELLKKATEILDSNKRRYNFPESHIFLRMQEELTKLLGQHKKLWTKGDY